jgi:hypothetical protein
MTFSWVTERELDAFMEDTRVRLCRARVNR